MCLQEKMDHGSIRQFEIHDGAWKVFDKMIGKFLGHQQCFNHNFLKVQYQELILAQKDGIFWELFKECKNTQIRVRMRKLWTLEFTGAKVGNMQEILERSLTTVIGNISNDRYWQNFWMIAMEGGCKGKTIVIGSSEPEMLSKAKNFKVA